MVLFLITVLCLALRQLFVWIRGMHHRRRLPPPAITSAQAAACQNQAFYEICRRSRGPGWRAVRMAEYFTDQGWNRADAMLILAEPLKHGLIKVYGWRFGMYGPTRTGWDEYRKNFMWSGGSDVFSAVITSRFC